MLNTEDQHQIERIETAATTISKSLVGMSNDDALTALVVVMADVIDQGFDPSQWHLALAEISMTLAANLGKGCDCDAEHGTEH